MKGDKRVIERLNEALFLELGAVNQYWLHYRLLNDWGYTKLAKKERAESIEEMQHADKLIDRIIFLEGHPNLQTVAPLRIGQNVKEVLEADLAGEYDARASYKKSRDICHEAGDYVSMKLFETLLIDEEGHIDFLETQLELLGKIGEEKYGQLNADSANEAEDHSNPETAAGGRLFLFIGKVPEFGNHFLVDAALERNDEFRQALHRLPVPGIEFGCVPRRWRIDLDFAFIAFEPECEPALCLAAIFTPQSDADQFRRKIVVNPVARFRQQPHRFHSRLFVKLANGRGQRPFTLINAPLWHLPQMRRAIIFGIAFLDAPAGPHQALGVQNHHPRTGTIGQIFCFDCHGFPALSERHKGAEMAAGKVYCPAGSETRAETPTISIPRPAASRDHREIAAMLSSKAEATPIA